MNFLDGVNIFAGVSGVGAVFGLVVYAARSKDEREAEEEARVFYDEHGYWPDEAPGLGDGADDGERADHGSVRAGDR